MKKAKLLVSDSITDTVTASEVIFIPSFKRKLGYKKKTFKVIPLDSEQYQYYLKVFGGKGDFSIAEGIDHEGRRIATTTSITKTGETTITFNVDGLNGKPLKEIHRLDYQDSRLWWSMICFAIEQGNGLTGSFTFNELMRFWKIQPKKRGVLRKEIESRYFKLASVTVLYKAKNKSELGVHFHLFKGKNQWTGRERRYSFDLDEDALGEILSKFLRGELTHEEFEKNKGKVLSYPKAYITDGLPETEGLFRDELFRIKGGYEIRLDTILVDMMGLPLYMLKRKVKSRKLVRSYLDNLVKRGDIKSYVFPEKASKKWKADKVVWFKANHSSKLKPEQSDLVERMMKHQTKRAKTEPEILRKQLTAVVRKNDLKKVTKDFEQTTTQEFWEKYKKKINKILSKNSD